MTTQLAPTATRPNRPPLEQYMIRFFMDERGNECACDWRWKTGATWAMSSREQGDAWYEDGPLTEEGRTEVLKHFGLEPIAGALPLANVCEMAPCDLLAARRTLEQEQSLPRLEPVSDRGGGHVPAELAA